MTHEEVAAVQQRTRDEWAKYQKAAEKAPRRFQHFPTPEAWAEHRRQLAEAIERGEIPF